MDPARVEVGRPGNRHDAGDAGRLPLDRIVAFGVGHVVLEGDPELGVVSAAVLEARDEPTGKRASASARLRR